MKKNEQHQSELDKKYMQIALEIAQQGEGFVNPNPLVGAVIVQNDKIIATGYHQKFGEAHAEINAIKSVTEPIFNATIYVNLEPCAHQGKTPACALEIIKHKFKRVVIASTDPNPLVAGKGVEIIRNVGITVSCGILENEAIELNQPFFKFIKTKLPFVVLKSAMSLDGKIACSSGESQWISCAESRKYVHKLRNKYAAILTGINTVIADNPIMNVRLENEKLAHPVRIILDTEACIPLDSKILNSQNFGKVIIAVGNNIASQKIKDIENKSAEVIVCPSDNTKIDLKFLMQKLGERGIDSVMIEAGGELNFECIKQGIVDKVIFFIAPLLIGGRNSYSPLGGEGFEKLAQAISLKNTRSRNIGTDIMVEADIFRW